ncbi:ATPase domain-containing protein [Scleromatobacter humisilvae]|uniref:non-specific serine/threonine protein kinase n=1 Tax=Scleromatobacter humisilvae TaxID=2897159 RepID=A0A9X2BZ24_9BURK|nr:ATPase domain-containing protein [Scleromatobacter humisilvae]MCK9686208.1 AAA family ATPase [Scleromatobacter humisilvae]
MTSSTTDNVGPIERLRSAVPGLDQILGGGLFRTGVYIIQGLPGCGKTILANQICYGHVAEGGSAVYVTLLAESHSRMIQHLSTLSFFDVKAFPDRLAYISAFHELESAGLKGLMGVLRREMRTRKVGVLVLDGLVAASEGASDLDLKKFIHELQSIAVLQDCTVLLLTSGNIHRMAAEHTMVDGLIEVEDKLFDARSERSIQVRKFRGAGPLRGKHSLRIDNDGITVFPRIESMYRGAATDAMHAEATTSGIPSLDAQLASRGLPKSSSTVVIGSTGTGKTTMGVQFVHASTPEEPGLHLSFFEGPERIRSKARSLGLDLGPLESSGAVELMWQTPGEALLDEVAERLLSAIARRNVRRLVIDGLSGFLDSTVYPERINRFFSCLVNELRSRQVTVLMTLETRDVVSSVVSMPWGVSGLVDNLFFLRFVHDEGHVERLLTIIKMRDTDYQAGLRRLRIDSQGMHIAGTYRADGDVIPSAQPVAGPEGPVPSPSK